MKCVFESNDLWFYSRIMLETVSGVMRFAVRLDRRILRVSCTQGLLRSWQCMLLLLLVLLVVCFFVVCRLLLVVVVVVVVVVLAAAAAGGGGGGGCCCCCCCCCGAAGQMEGQDSDGHKRSLY